MTSSVPKPPEYCYRQNKSKNFGYKKPDVDCLKEETIICEIPSNPTPSAGLNIYVYSNGGLIGNNEAEDVQSTHVYYQYINLRESLGGNLDNALVINKVRVLPALSNTNTTNNISVAIYESSDGFILSDMSTYSNSTMIGSGTIQISGTNPKFADISLDSRLTLRNNLMYFIRLYMEESNTGVKSNGLLNPGSFSQYPLQYLYYYTDKPGPPDTIPTSLPTIPSTTILSAPVFYYTLYNDSS